MITRYMISVLILNTKVLFGWVFFIVDGTLELNGEALVLTSLIPRYKGWPVSIEIIILVLHLHLVLVIFYRTS